MQDSSPEVVMIDTFDVDKYADTVLPEMGKRSTENSNRKPE